MAGNEASIRLIATCVYNSSWERIAIRFLCEPCFPTAACLLCMLWLVNHDWSWYEFRSPAQTAQIMVSWHSYLVVPGYLDNCISNPSQPLQRADADATGLRIRKRLVTGCKGSPCPLFHNRGG